MKYSIAVALLAAVAASGIVMGVVLAAPAASPVADVAHEGDRDAVRTLLRDGADVNAAQGDGMTALHWAAERGDAEMARMLVVAGANLEADTRVGRYTPLHVAARNGHTAVADVLIEAGSNVMARTMPAGSTPLHLAATAGDEGAAASLLARDAEVDARDHEWGQTPLIFAAARDRVAVLQLLLEAGADPSVTSTVINLKTDRELAEAGENRRKKVLRSYTMQNEIEGEFIPSASQFQAAVIAGRELYLSGKLPEISEADPDERRFDARLILESKGGLTALLHAARQGHTESVMALLDGDADVNQVGAGDGTTPLVMATINGHYDLAMRLIERGADPNTAASINGVTPLWAAVNAKWQPRTRFPQPQQFDFQETTYLDLMEALLKAGADVDARLTAHPWYMVYTDCGNRNCGLEDTNGSTAFWRAAYATDVGAMRLLVAHGADPQIPSLTPPPRRPRAGTASVFTEDEEKRPVQPFGPGLWPATDPRTVNPDPSGLPRAKEGDPGVFPIHAASGVGYGEGFAGNAHRTAPGAWLDAVKYLVEELGIDVNARDFNGYNALHHAAARGDNEMIEYLVEQGCDVTAVSRLGQTTADMANGPVQRVSPHPETVALLESLGSKNNHNCVTC